MKDLIFSYIEKFFDKNLDISKPVLLALSGGFDSTVLLHLLVMYKKIKNFDLHIAHIDHGWRKTSCDEADKLEKIAFEHSLVFHLKKLADIPEKNKEDMCRKKRYEFFLELSQKIPFQAVILAHQADDQAETILKRMLEGSHLINLFGMKEISIMKGLVIWRPLLKFSRKEIVRYLNKYNLSCFDDITNYSPFFLRSRIRNNILPFLKKEFGKEITSNLCLLGQRANDLQNYLDEKIVWSMKKLIKGPLGLYLPENGHRDLKDLEKLHLVKKLMQDEKIDVSRNILEKIVKSLALSSKTISFPLKDALIIVDKSRLFIFLKPPQTPPNNIIPLHEGENYFGLWKITLEKNISSVSSASWESIWNGEAVLLLDKRNYFLSLAKKDGKYIYPKIKKVWNEKKVPHFLRNHLPILFSDKEIVYDFVDNNKNKKEMISPYYIAKLRLLNN